MKGATLSKNLPFLFFKKKILIEKCLETFWAGISFFLLPIISIGHFPAAHLITYLIRVKFFLFSNVINRFISSIRIDQFQLSFRKIIKQVSETQQPFKYYDSHIYMQLGELLNFFL